MVARRAAGQAAGANRDAAALPAFTDLLTNLRCPAPPRLPCRVQRFNADPTIDVMLLTTAVGGLGLNLTAADTVIFLEHDWNPMKDLQVHAQAGRVVVLVAAWQTQSCPALPSRVLPLVYCPLVYCPLVCCPPQCGPLLCC